MLKVRPNGWVELIEEHVPYFTMFKNLSRKERRRGKDGKRERGKDFYLSL